MMLISEKMQTVVFDLTIRVQERKGYFAATSTPFVITAYGNTPDEAEERALEAVNLLLGNTLKHSTI